MHVNDLTSLGVVAVVLVLVVGFFMWIAVRLRRGGGSLTTIVLGATDGFLNRDRRRAAETIVNENAGKKFEEQESAGPGAREGDSPP
jgi:hypothetical protein